MIFWNWLFFLPRTSKHRLWFVDTDTAWKVMFSLRISLVNMIKSADTCRYVNARPKKEKQTTKKRKKKAKETKEEKKISPENRLKK